MIWPLLSLQLRVLLPLEQQYNGFHSSSSIEPLTFDEPRLRFHVAAAHISDDKKSDSTIIIFKLSTSYDEMNTIVTLTFC